MVVRFLGVLNACILSIGFTTNTYAALATADITLDWGSLVITNTGDLEIIPTWIQTDASVLAAGGKFDSWSVPGFGGIDISSIGPSSSASVVDTGDLIDASADTTAGFAWSRFERAVDYEAVSGSGVLSLSVDVVVQGEVQGAGSEADATIVFGHWVGATKFTQVSPFAWIGSLASIELRGDLGDRTESLPTTLSFSVPMTQGDVVTIFAEGEIDVVSPIPIPAAAWLFGSGLLGLIGVAARRKKAA